MKSIQAMSSLVLLLLIITLVSIVSTQKVIKEATVNDPHAIFELNSNISSEECLKQIQTILTPQQLQTLGAMINLSGKGINQLGLYESCNHDDLEYTLLYVELQLYPLRFSIIFHNLVLKTNKGNKKYILIKTII